MKLLNHFGILLLSMILISSCTTKKDVAAVAPRDVFQLNVKPAIVEVDNLGRLYLVDEGNNIINYTPELKEQYRYANKRSGQVSSLDVTNPLKVVSFSNDFNQVLYLDNTLSVISELNLSEKFADISACGTSNDGNLWVYDPTQFKMMKINDQGSILLETSNVNDVGITNVNITDIKERGNYVIMCDREKGFYVFDNMGQYMYHYEAKGIKSIQFDGRNIYYFTNTGLKSYSIKFKEKVMISYPFDMSRQDLKYVVYSSGDIYEVYQTGINVLKTAKK